MSSWKRCGPFPWVSWSGMRSARRLYGSWRAVCYMTAIAVVSATVRSCSRWSMPVGTWMWSGRFVRSRSGRPWQWSCWRFSFTSDFDTGEIKRSRPALAAELGVSPKVVSELMGELFKLGAVERSYDDGEGHRVRSVRYF